MASYRWDLVSRAPAEKIIGGSEGRGATRFGMEEYNDVRLFCISTLAFKYRSVRAGFFSDGASNEERLSSGAVEAGDWHQGDRVRGRSAEALEARWVRGRACWVSRQGRGEGWVVRKE